MYAIYCNNFVVDVISEGKYSVQLDFVYFFQKRNLIGMSSMRSHVSTNEFFSKTWKIFWKEKDDVTMS
jgi:hypothetical protein